MCALIAALCFLATPVLADVAGVASVIDCVQMVMGAYECGSIPSSHPGHIFHCVFQPGSGDDDRVAAH